MARVGGRFVDKVTGSFKSLRFRISFGSVHGANKKKIL